MLGRFAVRLNDVAKRHMLSVSIAFTGLKYGMADQLVQLADISQANAKGEQMSSDWKRTLLLTSFGAMYTAGPGFLFYCKIYPRLLPRKPIISAGFDSGVQTPFVYMSQYYIMAEFIKDLTSPSASFRSSGETLTAGLATWKTNLVEDYPKQLLFWLPAQVLNFWFVPLHLRILYMASIGFVWSILLSTWRGNAMDESKEASRQSQQAAHMTSTIAISDADATVSAPAAAAAVAAAVAISAV